MILRLNLLQQEDSEWDEFGNDLYAIPEVLPVQSSSQATEVASTSKTDEENKLKALINTPALDWQRLDATTLVNFFGPSWSLASGCNLTTFVILAVKVLMVLALVEVLEGEDEWDVVLVIFYSSLPFNFNSNIAD